MLIPLRCLPLTVNLRGTGPEENNSGVSNPSEDLGLILGRLRDVTDGIVFEDPWVSDYDYRQLFGAKWRIKNKSSSSSSRRTIDRMTPRMQIIVLRAHTYWFKRLAPASQYKVKTLLERGRTGLLKLKEILHYSDAVVVGLLLSNPEKFVSDPYEITDRLHNCVISNLLHNFLNFELMLKKFRKTLRFHMFNKLPFPSEEFGGKGAFRHISFYKSLTIDDLNLIYESNSRHKMYMTLMNSQTRASGLASEGLMKLSLAKFKENVSVKREFSPNPQLVQAIDRVLDQVVGSSSYGSLPNLKISISTSSCQEIGKQKGGKYKFAQNILREFDYPKDQLDLFFDGDAFTIEGEEDEFIVSKLPYQTFGEIVWTTAYAIYDDPNVIRKVNVAAVRENGKARIVTSGSFWKDALLQPFSHLTIEMCKVIKCISNAFQAAKHGWQWIRDIEDFQPLKDSSFEGWKAYCSDWENATDAPSPDSGRAIVGKLLEKMLVPDHVIQVLMNTWLGDKVARVSRNSSFIIRNGIMMGDPLTKTNLCLAHPICLEYARIQIKRIDPLFPFAAYGHGNGDDLAFIFNHPLFPRLYSEAAGRLGYKESVLDTFVSEDWLFYCEEAFHIPKHSRNYVSISQKHKNIDLLPYLDYPRIRLLIDTQKDREDFSSSTLGKFTLIGKEVNFLPDDSVLYNFYQFASAMQDVLLDIHNCPDLPIAPHQLLGVGKPPIGFSVDSLKNFLNRSSDWKRKLLKRIIYEEVFEDRVLLSFRGIVGLGQKHFADESIAEIYSIPADDKIKDHILVRKENVPSFPPGVIERLVEGGHLCYESGLLKYYLMNRRFKGLRENAQNFSLFDTLKVELAHVEEPDLDDYILELFLERWQKRAYSFKRVIPEDVYDVRTVRELLVRDPIRINDIGFDLSGTLEKFRSGPLNPNSPYELQTNRLYNWFKEVVDFDDDDVPIERFECISEGRIEYALGAPTNLIEDDSVIIGDVVTSQSMLIAIVTNDIKLHRLARNKAYDKVIIRIPISTWLKTPGEDGEKILDLWTRFGCTTWVDHGNVEGYRNRIDTGATEFVLSSRFPWKGSLPRTLERIKNPMLTAGINLSNVTDLIEKFGDEMDLRKWDQYLDSLGPAPGGSE
jgi:hypothetical protein